MYWCTLQVKARNGKKVIWQYGSMYRMPAIKVTFTLDPETIDRLKEASARLSKPKSGVVRDAILEYHKSLDRLSESERQRMLRVLRDIKSRPPTRSQDEVEQELREIRRARRSAGRRTRIRDGR